MRRIIVSSFAVLALLIVAGSPVAETAALAAQKRACQCKPTLRRSRARSAKSRVATRPRVVAPTANNSANQYGNGSRAEVVGPVFVNYTLPQNQYFRLRMNESVNSETSRRGDRFKATVLTPVYASGAEVVPAGSIIEGRVTSVVSARSRGREGQIAVAFDTLVLPDGTKHGIDGALTELQDDRSGEVDAENRVSGRSDEKRKITYIGGGTAGGAVLGGMMGGAKGAGIGAVLGAGAGVAGVMLSKGHEAELRRGTEIGMVTTQPVEFSVRSDRYNR